MSATSCGHLRWLAVVLTVLLISACATTPPDPDLLNNAQAAIARANQAGGETHAPLELRLASRRLAMAQEQIDQGNIAGARHLADQAQIEAELAFARTRAALARGDLEAKRQAFEALQADLVELYGEEVLP
ncbi:MAG TPA: DUF4398 domain-containing protein [Wenzhouxiangella sp.]